MCTAGVAAVGQNIAAALWGAFGAAVGIGIAYEARKDWLRTDELAGSWRELRTSRRRQAPATIVALLLVGGSVVLGPLISWVFATTLALIMVLAVWATWLALRA
jgi:hypothetical protein